MMQDGKSEAPEEAQPAEEERPPGYYVPNDENARLISILANKVARRT